MAMRVKHVQRAPSLNHELMLAKAFDEAKPVEVVLQIERHITKTGDGRWFIGTFYSSWNTVVDNKSISYAEDNYRYTYSNGDFRRYMRNEIVALRNYVNRLKKDYISVSVTIIRSYTEFHDYPD